MNTDSILTEEIANWREKHKVNLVPKCNTKSVEQCVRYIVSSVMMGVGVKYRDNIKMIIREQIISQQHTRKSNFAIGHLYWNKKRVEPLSDEGNDLIGALVKDCIFAIGRNMLLNTLPKDEQAKVRKEKTKTEAGR